MNCDSIFHLVSQEIDGELTGEDAVTLHRHLDECPACCAMRRELLALDRDLARCLPPPFVESGMRQLHTRIAPQKDLSSAAGSSRRIQSGLVIGMSVCALAVAMLLCGVTLPASVAVAEIALATGPVEVKLATTSKWVSADGRRPVTLAAHTRIRTRSESLCEIRTRTAAVVRMNRETEMIVHPGERLELVTGELWCRASPSQELEVRAPTQNSLSLFACPSSTETQWTARPNQELSCTSVSPNPVQLKTPDLQYTIEPGQRLELGDPTALPELRPGRQNRLKVTRWQLPLLLLRNPKAPEVQEHLLELLATLGATKASHLSESQIRDLGPVGAIPLLAFVQSPRSLEQPGLRLQAMRLAAEMASVISRPDLETLQLDADPVIRNYAHGALLRLSELPGTRGSAAP